MSKFLDMDGLQYYTNKFKPGLANVIDNGEKNLLNYDLWASTVGVTRGEKSVTPNTIQLTATGNDCNTKWGTDDYPQFCRIAVSEGNILIFTWKYEALNDQTNDMVYIFGNSSATESVYTYGQKEYLSYTIPSGVTYITFRIGVQTSGNSAKYSNLMVCTLDDYNISQEYQPYHKNIATNNDIIQMWENS